MFHLTASYGKGALAGLLAARVDGSGILVSVLIALVAAVLAWVVFHFIAPAYEQVAAVVAFLVVLLLLLLA